MRFQQNVLSYEFMENSLLPIINIETVCKSATVFKIYEYFESVADFTVDI